jgi:hypothetical protein
MEYSFCEGVWATPYSRWHIRQLTEKGRKLGGDIDTPSLCGKIKEGWDLEVEIDAIPLSDKTVCPECAKLYKK